MIMWNSLAENSHRMVATEGITKSIYGWPLGTILGETLGPKSFGALGFVKESMGPEMESHWRYFDYGLFGAKGFAILSQKVPFLELLCSYEFETQRL